MVTSIGCTPEFGCARGAFNPAQSTTEAIDSNNRVTEGNIGVDYYFSGQNATDVFYMTNGVNMIDQFFPFFIIESVANGNGQSGIIFPYDGIMGLSPDVDGDTLISLGVPIPLHLKNTNKIASGIAAIDMYADPTI